MHPLQGSMSHNPLCFCPHLLRSTAGSWLFFCRYILAAFLLRMTNVVEQNTQGLLYKLFFLELPTTKYGLHLPIDSFAIEMGLFPR